LKHSLGIKYFQIYIITTPPKQNTLVHKTRAAYRSAI